MVEAEVKQLVEVALVIDSLICKQLGLTWERVMGASVGPKLETDRESTATEMYQEGTAVQSESATELQQGKLSMETVMELLCNEAVRNMFRVLLHCSERSRI